MTGWNANVPTWWQNIVAELKRDRMKAAMLGVLAATAAVMGLLLAFGKPSPAGAGAAVTAGAPQALAPRPARLADEAISQAVLPGHVRRPIQRDLFLPNADFFPPEQAPDQAPVRVTSAPAEPDRRAEAQAIRNQAKAMVLQSTVVSGTPTAIINNRVLRIGDWITGFQLLEIGPASCTLRKDDVQVTLEMKRRTED